MNHWLKFPAEFEVTEVRRWDAEIAQRVRVEIEYRGERADERDARPGFWFMAPMNADQPQVGDTYELRPKLKVRDAYELESVLQERESGAIVGPGAAKRAARRLSTAAQDPRVAYEEGEA